MNNTTYRYTVAILAFILYATGALSPAFSQCNGQFAAGTLCGNAGGGLALPIATLPSALFDSIYGTAPGTIIYRGSSGWTSFAGNTSGTKLLSEDSSGNPSWAALAGTGTVTSVGLSLPNIFTVSGSPVTTTGTLSASLASQNQNLVFASPNGTSGTPGFRALVLADFPSIGTNTVLGNATSGSALPSAQSMPSCSTSTSALIWTTNTGFGCQTITGTGTVTSVATGTGLTGGTITTTGTISLAPISADNLLGNASGTSAAPGAVPLLSCSAAQQGLTYNTSTHAFGCNTISGSGTVIAGTAGELAWYSGSTNVIVGNANANISNGTLTLGTNTTTLGSIILEGSSSGAVTLTPQAAAGTPTITFGTSSGTPVVTASAPLAITSATGNITVTGVAGQVLAGSTPAFTATPTLGAATVATGQLKLAGTTSGTVTFSVLDAAGTWTMKLPSTGGSSGQFLSTDGSGNTSWASPSGSGTVSSGTAGQLTYYGSTGTTASGNANANISSGALTLGQANSTIGQLILEGSTSGALTITPQATAGTPTWTAGTASGTPVVTASAPLSIATATGNITITGAAGQVLAGATPAFTATPTLGASGTLGTLTLGNATSGTVTIEAVTGALGTVTASLPANSGTIAELNLAQTWTGAQTFTNGDLLLKGSSSGAMTLEAPAVASTYIMTFPAATDTVAVLGTAQTFTAVQTFTNSDIRLLGSSTGYTALTSANAGASNFTWTLPGVSDTFAGLNTTDQVLAGGSTVTSYSIGTVSSGTSTVDCGKSPLQYLTNGGAFTLAAPSNDGSCVIQITNNGSAGAVSFSGFTVNASYTGGALTTTNTNKFMVSVTRVNGSSIYNIIPQQ